MGIKSAVLVIDGRPVPWQRAGRNGKRTYTPARTAAQEARIRTSYAASIGEKIEPPVSVEMVFTYKIPKSWTKSKKEQALAGKIPMDSRPDIDNLAKLCMDALNGYAYDDDGCVIKIAAFKRYGTSDSTVIKLSNYGKSEM